MPILNRSTRSWLLRAHQQVDDDPSACYLVHHHLERFAWPVGFCESRRCQCHFLSHCYGPGLELYHSDFFVSGAKFLFDRNLSGYTWNRRRVYEHHPEVQFKPGPFYMGNGILGWAVNINCILWTLFVTVIFSIPTLLPVTKENMNYASVITGGVIILAWCVLPSCIESLRALAFP